MRTALLSRPGVSTALWHGKASYLGRMLSSNPVKTSSISSWKPRALALKPCFSLMWRQRSPRTLCCWCPLVVTLQCCKSPGKEFIVTWWGHKNHFDWRPEGWGLMVLFEGGFRWWKFRTRSSSKLLSLSFSSTGRWWTFVFSAVTTSFAHCRKNMLDKSFSSLERVT